MLHCPRNITRAVAYSSLFLAAGVASALAADPTGDWRVEDGVANIRIAECNGSMWGVVSWEKTPGGRDKNNPDASKQNRPTLAMPTLLDMKKKPGVDQWEGKVYNANDGQIYSATIKPLGSDQLQVQGCLLGFLCGGQTWTRVAGPIPSSPVNSMARGAPKTAGAARTAAPSSQPPPLPRKPPGRSTRLPKRGRSRPRVSPATSAISAYSPISRGLPISAGWNNSTAASVVTRDSASSLPMLAVPG
jgi:uncharacterized protein (DUF2147 family)